MNLTGLLSLIQQAPGYRSLLDALRGREERQRDLGLLAAARPYVIAALQRDLAVPVLVVAARGERARQLADQLRVWSPTPGGVRYFPGPDALFYERVPWAPETTGARLAALAALTEASDPPPIVVTSARALMQRTMPVVEFRAGVRTLRRGQLISLHDTLAAWVGLGYEPEAVVEEPGTFSRRGGIVDVYPPHAPWPVRIELFGDEIESLRTFDPATQRSRQRIEAFTLAPASEALLRLAPVAAGRVAGLDVSGCHPSVQAEYRRDREALAQGQRFRELEFYLPYLYDPPGTLLDYLPAGGLLIVDDWSELAAAVAELEERAVGMRAEFIENGELPADFALPYATWDELEPALRRRRPLGLGYGLIETSGEAGRPLRHLFVPGPRYGGQLRRVLDGVLEMRRSQRVVVASRQAGRLSDLLAEKQVFVTPVEALDGLPPERSLTLVQGTLDEGWAFRVEGRETGGEGAALSTVCTLLTDAEIFGWARPVPRRPRQPRAVTPETFFADVSPGDYVVHIEHGIGLFQGLARLEVDGIEHEYLQVDYAAGDRLYVPIHQADRLSRYVGLGERVPAMHRLGATDWERVKARAKRAVEDIAEDLLNLYAARETVEGHAFAPDAPWQAELEAGFPYVETPDQLQAVEAVKRDMEQRRPMDRLICGDVGYGKTEVALRAAFKAVMDGKQVAVLVPTTVLAQQHYGTFKERLAPFPVNVEMLSRFRTRSKQQRILEGMKSGAVDIVIGTHRLIQKDVAFKDLGLLIIDEEQRFGVTHKERLKRMRTEVDVLTLTATPIPRTLHMSLSGVRDMSTIETPPEERLPIRTYLSEYDETLIRQAILRELERGGQVYFVHNRVMGIQQMARRVQKIVPEATVAVGHGQMPERELERVMLSFAAGETDVLVCTSIIESGLDIPNVNTIVINRAHTFGLAQLYQLRGRVGRSARRAYAYLLYPPHHRLSDVARSRLEAIMEASELGAGFRIAMRDLEIRGAGELLGARQHGHIAAVGFDLYCRLLAQAVQEQKQKRAAKATGVGRPEAGGEGAAHLRPLGETVQINLSLSVALPADYVPDPGLRLQLYRRLAGLATLAEIDDVAQELADRFGPLPPPAADLLYQLRLKVLALAAGVPAITVEEGQILVKAPGVGPGEGKRLQRRLGHRARVGRRQVWLSLSPQAEVWKAALVEVLRVMGRGEN